MLMIQLDVLSKALNRPFIPPNAPPPRPAPPKPPPPQPAPVPAAVAQLTNGLSAQPWRGQPSEADRASPEGLPHYRIHRVRGNFDGEERYLRISMAEQDGWYLQQIVSAPLAEAPAAEDISGVSWRAGLQAFAEARAQAEPAR